jgi:ElaB/YqjD/DUF883 family membrane-anchored ribosome-binding protein
MADVNKILKDAFYVTVGLGVIVFQRAQVQRQELRKQIEAQVGEARENAKRFSGTLEQQVKAIEDRLETLESRVDQSLDELEERLPEQARELVHQARAVAKDARTQLRELVGRNGKTTAGTSAA